jgi:glycosyltransferase involved in cell wall biosynthesis
MFALGPARSSIPWSLPGDTPSAVWLNAPEVVRPWMLRYTWLRWRQGQVTSLRDRALGKWAAAELERLRPRSCYLFTQVALESLRWCRREGIPTVLDNPNGHIRNYAQICEKESVRWSGKRFHGHPSSAMIERVEEEYELVDRIRVYSEWGKASMLRFGVPQGKIHILRQTVNLDRFRPAAVQPPVTGPLRVCYVGSLDLRKGFVYLLQAIRAVGVKRIELRIVGATGDRDCAKLLARESAGLQIEVAPGNSLPVYQESELLVIPTLEDGLPFVLVEGLACGLPVIVTREAGASECVRSGRSGWVVPAGDVEALGAALEEALSKRAELWRMGQAARADVERYAGPAQLSQLSDWIYNLCTAEVSS